MCSHDKRKQKVKSYYFDSALTSNLHKGIIDKAIEKEMTQAEHKIIKALGAENAHKAQPKIKDVGVYN